jgi:outer membrane protein OmpA-like peptidoglycan-associated protein
MTLLTTVPRIASSSILLAAIVLLVACAAEKELAKVPVAGLSDPEGLFTEQKVAPATPEIENTNDVSAGKSKSKGSKRQSAKEKQASAGKADGDEDEDDDSNSDVLSNSNIFFQYASSELTPAAKKELSRVAAILKRNKSARVTLSGHTCDRSSSSVNMRLSQKRAKAASVYLQQLGISARRINTEAYGSSQPLVPNTSERSRAKNRRVEVTAEY